MPEIDDLVSSLTIDERARLVTGADTWSTTGNERIGLESILMSDGPSGVRGAAWDERKTSVSFPCGVALGASFDAHLLELVGQALGHQASERGVNVLLGPTINLQRAPQAGRHFEYFSEDPYLTALLATAYIRGLQSRGVAASPKHFVANDSETERHTVDVRASESILREVSLLPFEAAVRDAGTWTIMAAYNSVDGTPMTANARLLGTVLRDEWGFDGVALSDWGAVYDTELSIAGPLDLAMPGPHGNWGEPLREALAEGRVDPDALTAKARNIVRLAARTGRLVGTTGDAEAQQPTIDASSIARQAAEQSITLLKNEAAVLPLDPVHLKRVVVIGPNAARPVTQGGGSAHVNAISRPGPVEALASALGDGVTVVTAPGCDTRVRVPALGTEVATVDPLTGAPGVGVEYCDAQGRVLLREVRAPGRLVWYGALPDDLPPSAVASVAVHARVDVSAADRFEIGISAMSSQQLYVDGKLELEVDRTTIVGSDLFHNPHEARTVVSTAGRSTLDLTVRQGLYVRRELAVCFIGMQEADRDPNAELDAAVALAASADVVLLMVGTNSEVESEGFDRATLALPGRQDELIRRVSAANANAVVVVNAGAPVLMPWVDDVRAVLATWFGGEWAAEALARVITGLAEPGGRLPFTWPRTQDARGLAATEPVDGRLEYGHGVEVRNRVEDADDVLYPFGYGLGYSTWVVEHASLRPPGTTDGAILGSQEMAGVGIRLRNIGERPGATIALAFARFTDDGDKRGTRALVGVARVTGGAGEASTIDLGVPRRLVQRWDEVAAGWVDREVLGFQVEISGSSVWIPLAEMDA